MTTSLSGHIFWQKVKKSSWTNTLYIVNVYYINFVFSRWQSLHCCLWCHTSWLSWSNIPICNSCSSRRISSVCSCADIASSTGGKWRPCVPLTASASETRTVWLTAWRKWLLSSRAHRLKMRVRTFEPKEIRECVNKNEFHIRCHLLIPQYWFVEGC